MAGNYRKKNFIAVKPSQVGRAEKRQKQSLTHIKMISYFLGIAYDGSRVEQFDA